MKQVFDSEQGSILDSGIFQVVPKIVRGGGVPRFGFGMKTPAAFRMCVQHRTSESANDCNEIPQDYASLQTPD